MMYIILSVCLVAIAAYYPIKLIKFYCMESKEQSVKQQIISDLRAGRINRSLVGIILGEGGFRLERRELDHIFEWMVMNTDEWQVKTTPDNGRFIILFFTSPFHPAYWQDYETYKNVMRQMFGEYGTKDFCSCRASMAEAFKIQRNTQALNVTEEPARVRVFDYVRMMFGDEKVLAIVVDISDTNVMLVTILSGEGKGQKYWVARTKDMEVIPNGAAISELVRLKGEWKEEKREEAIAKQHEEFREKYGNIVRGSYLKSGISLYIVESVDVAEEKATAIRLLYSFIKQPAGEKCILPLENGFKLITAEEAAEIILKEYSNE